MITDFIFFGGYDKAIKLCLNRADKNKKTKVFTPNAEMLAMAMKDKRLMSLLRKAELPLADGIGVYVAAKRHGIRPLERTNGIDFAERLLKAGARKGMSVFLLGAMPRTSKKAAHSLEKKIKGLSVAGFHHGYFEKHGAENDSIISQINRSGAEILFVCLGFPAQEKWICENLPRLRSVKIAVGLGGSLDVWSGDVARAPLFFRQAGLEWLWRVLSSPKRISRIPRLFYFARLYFMYKSSNSVKQKGNLLQNR